MMKKDYTAHMSVLAGNLLFGLNYSYSKSVMDGGIGSIALAELRMVIAAILFLVASKVMGANLRVERKDIFKLFIGSVFGVVLNQLLFLKGLEYTSPVDASIITTLNPLLVLLISAIFLSEKITFYRLVGIVVGALGALLVIVNGGVISFGHDQLFGNFIVLLAALAYACYMVWIKPLMVKYSAMTVMTWIFGFGAILSVPICGRVLMQMDWAAITPDTYNALIFVLLGATFGAYFLIGYGLKYISPTTVAMYNYSQPVVAAFFAIMRGQDTFNVVKLMAALLVFLGVFIVVRSYGRSAKK